MWHRGLVWKSRQKSPYIVQELCESEASTTSAGRWQAAYKYAGLVDYLVLDEKSLLLLGGMLKPSVRYRGLEQRQLDRLITCRSKVRILYPQPTEEANHFEGVDTGPRYLRHRLAPAHNYEGENFIRFVGVTHPRLTVCRFHINPF